MTGCAACGGGLEMVDSNGATDDGHFREEYRCLNCRARGYISGEASDCPTNWNKYGSAFDDV